MPRENHTESLPCPRLIGPTITFPSSNTFCMFTTETEGNQTYGLCLMWSRLTRIMFVIGRAFFHFEWKYFPSESFISDYTTCCSLKSKDILQRTMRRTRRVAPTTSEATAIRDCNICFVKSLDVFSRIQILSFSCEPGQPSASLKIKNVYLSFCILFRGYLSALVRWILKLLKMNVDDNKLDNVLSLSFTPLPLHHHPHHCRVISVESPDSITIMLPLGIYSFN